LLVFNPRRRRDVAIKILDDSGNVIFKGKRDLVKEIVNLPVRQSVSLESANLTGVKGIITIYSNGKMFIAVIHKDGPMIQDGVFWGTLEDFRAKVRDEHANDDYAMIQLAVADLISIWAEARKAD